MQDILVAVHFLAAAVWLGGTVALVFVGVPVVRTLEGEARAHAMRALGARWRRIGYAALGLAIVTGIPLATHDWDDDGSSFHWVFAVKAVLVAIGRRIKLYEPPYPNAKMGSINAQEFKTEAELNGLKIPDYSGFFTNELIDAIDNYDVKKIQAQAVAYKR